ncbi:MAG: hypothetical protein K6G53_07640 [Bacteroidales bacterium]|nr:hypothetical protein [Bacteroidales bacterium]MBR3527001.1 hypothetical protein [Bacteroidales bacterium]MCR5828271.1 hypothetical protein [Bacteroidales bacterium]
MARILELILLGISAVLLVLFFTSPHDTASDPIVNTYLYWTYILFFVALVLLVIFQLIQIFSSKRGIINFVLLLVGIAVLVGLSFVLAKGGPVNTSVAYTESVSKFSDAALILTYILGGAAIVALLWSVIKNAITNR